MHTELPVTNVLSIEPASPTILPAKPGQLRVLHVVNRLDLGGTESGILKVIAGLRGEEFIHAICTARGHSSEFTNQRAFSGRIYDANGTGTPSKFMVGRFARVMREYRPHIVHSRNWGAIEAVFAARLAGVPVAIHSEHGYELDILKGLPLRRRLLRRAAYATADAVFAVSADLRDYHARQAWISPTKISVVANGVDSKRFAPRLQDKLACRAGLRLPENSLLVGTVGRLVPIKDQALLLHAAKILLDRGFDLSMALAGDGSELERLGSLAASLSISSRVYFLGASRKVEDFLNALDVFVLPSVSEGMSNTVLEAMSSGLPVVATRVGGNPELIEDKVSGLLFEVGNIEQLVERLTNLTKNAELRHSLGASARARILAQYRLDGMIDRYRDLYRRLAARRKVFKLQAA